MASDVNRPALRLTRLWVKDIRAFDEIEVKLDLAETRNWLLVLADNGMGKSTLLRCAAMGMCDQSSASALLRELPGEFVRKGKLEGAIEVELEDDHQNSYRIRTTIKKITRQLQDGSASGTFTLFERVTDTKYWEKPSGETEWQHRNEGEFPWENVFVCAYGAGRDVDGVESYEKFAPVDAVYTLFQYGQYLQNPELAIYRAKEAGKKEGRDENSVEDWIGRMLQKILMLEDYDPIELEPSGIVLPGPWGRELLDNTADGYKATTTWVLDFLSWNLLPPRSALPQQVSGIVLVDEIEQHLHPRWQRDILGRLADQFPNVQFIVSTHSPLCAVGTTDLKDEECRLLLLDSEDGRVVSGGLFGPPRGKRADQVLTSYLFGLPTSGDNEVKRQIERYAVLAGKERTPSEQREYEGLGGKLDQTLGSAETELETTVAAAVREVLSRGSGSAEKAADYEILRQLRELLGKHKDAQ